MESKTRKIEDLPQDLIGNIFSRLPIHHLLSCRYVSQSWRYLLPLKTMRWRGIEHLPEHFIKNVLSQAPTTIPPLLQTIYIYESYKKLIRYPRLLIMHYNRSCQYPNPSNLIIWYSSDVYYVPDIDTCEKVIKLNNPPVPNWLQRFVIMGSCNGFICLRDRELSCHGNFYICNPVTGYWIQLPDSSPRLTQEELGVGVGVGEDEVFFGFGCGLKNGNQYKVIRMRRDVNTYPMVLRVEILTLGSNGWRTIDIVGEYDITRRNIGAGGDVFSGVFVNGRLHWLIINDKREMVGIKAFDLDEENFVMVPIPDSMKKITYRNHLGVFGACLMIVDYVERDLQGDRGVLGERETQLQLMMNLHAECNLQIWLMKDYGMQESWICEFVIPNPSYTSITPLGMQKNGNVLLSALPGSLRIHKGLFSYDPKSETLQELEMPGLLRRFMAIPHVGTLVTPNDVIP